jgi:hypothetical protein
VSGVSANGFMRVGTLHLLISEVRFGGWNRLLLDGACVSLTWNAKGVSFAS